MLSQNILTHCCSHQSDSLCYETSCLYRRG